MSSIIGVVQNTLNFIVTCWLVGWFADYIVVDQGVLIPVQSVGYTTEEYFCATAKVWQIKRPLNSSRLWDVSKFPIPTAAK